MVGTSSTSVTRSRSMVCSTSRASKAVASTCVSPAMNCTSARPMPPMWNSGATCSAMLPSGMGVCAKRWMPMAHSVQWLCITPLGKPVVPPV